MTKNQIKLRYSKYGRNMYVILYGTPDQARIDAETALLKYRAEMIHGEYDKELFKEAIADDFEK